MCVCMCGTDDKNSNRCNSRLPGPIKLKFHTEHVWLIVNFLFFYFICWFFVCHKWFSRISDFGLDYREAEPADVMEVTSSYEKREIFIDAA